MHKPSKTRGSTATKARRVASMLVDVLRESNKPGGTISLEEAFRELEERERKEATHGEVHRPKHRASRRS